jgi:hypothetical protein
MADDRLILRVPPTLRQRLHEAAQADGRTISGMARKVLDSALDTAAPLSNADRATFGHNAKRHPVLGFLIEDGVGALPIEQQAEAFVKSVEASHGKPAADVLRRELQTAKERT